MGKASTSVASGHRAQVLLWPSVRTYVTSGVAVACAGILAAGIVNVPPDVQVARTEVRAVQLVALTLPSTAPSAAILEKFVRNQAQISAPVTPVVQGGVTDITAAVVRTSGAAAIDSTIDPAINRQEVGSAALVATTAASGLGAIIAPLINNAIVGPLILFGPLIVLVILACPPCALFNFLTFTIPSFFIPFAPLSAVAAASTATVEANATVVPSLTSDPPSQVTETGNADVSPPVTSIDKRSRAEQVRSTEPATGSEQMSTDTVTLTRDVTETAKTDEASAGPIVVSDPKPSAGASTSEPTKPTVRPAKRRPVARDSLGVGEQMLDPSQRSNNGRPSTRATADDGVSTTGSSSDASSSAASSSTASSSSGGGSSDGDADGS